MCRSLISVIDDLRILELGITEMNFILNSCFLFLSLLLQSWYSVFG